MLALLTQPVVWFEWSSIASLFTGIGGHGGTGIHADLQDKYAEIVQRVSLHTQPDLVPCVDATFLPPPPAPLSSSHMPSDSHRFSDRFSGYRTSMSSLSEVDFEGRPGQHHAQRSQFQTRQQRDASLDVMLSRYEDISSGGDGESRAGGRPGPHRGAQGPSVRHGRSMSSSNISNRGVPQANVKQCAICHILWLLILLLKLYILFMLFIIRESSAHAQMWIFLLNSFFSCYPLKTKGISEAANVASFFLSPYWIFKNFFHHKC